MKPAREQLIARLSADLQPVNKPAGGAAVLTLWLFGAGLFSLLALLLAGPFRVGSLQQMVDTPRFALENLLGLVTIVALGVSGLRLAIPSITPLRARVTWPLALLVAWLALYAYGFHAPSLPPSMDGKRALCFLEAAIDGLPGLALGAVGALAGLWLLRER